MRWRALRPGPQPRPTPLSLLYRSLPRSQSRWCAANRKREALQSLECSFGTLSPWTGTATASRDQTNRRASTCSLPAPSQVTFELLDKNTITLAGFEPHHETLHCLSFKFPRWDLGTSDGQNRVHTIENASRCFQAYRTDFRIAGNFPLREIHLVDPRANAQIKLITDLQQRLVSKSAFSFWPVCTANVRSPDCVLLQVVNSSWTLWASTSSALIFASRFVGSWITLFTGFASAALLLKGRDKAAKQNTNVFVAGQLHTKKGYQHTWACRGTPPSSGPSAPLEGKTPCCTTELPTAGSGGWVWALCPWNWELLAPLPCEKMWLRGIASNPQPPHRSGHGCTVGYDRDPPVWCPPPGRMRRDIRAPALTYTVCVGVHAVAHGRVCWRFFYCSLGSSARTFIFFVHPFVLSSPFSLLSLSPLFLYFSISMFLFLFFSLPHVSLSVFLHRRFLRIPFLFWNILLLSLLILIPLFSYFFTLFSSYPSLFFLPKTNSKFSVVNFLMTKMSFFFWTLSLSEYFLVCFPPCVVIFHCLSNVFWFSRFFIITYLDFLLPIFFLGLFKKSFCKKIKKTLILFSILFLLKKKNLFFLIFTTLRYKTALHAWSSKNILSFVCVFIFFFEKYLLYPFWIC